MSKLQLLIVGLIAVVIILIIAVIGITKSKNNNSTQNVMKNGQIMNNNNMPGMQH